jgi:hypothetical protein
MNPSKYVYYKLNWDLLGGKKKKDTEDSDEDSDEDKEEKEESDEEESEDDESEEEESEDEEDKEDKEESEDEEDDKDKKKKKKEEIPESFKNEVLSLIKNMSANNEKLPQIMSSIEKLQQQIQDIKKDEDKILQRTNTPNTPNTPNTQTSTPIINNVISPYPQYPMQMGMNQNPMELLATQAQPPQPISMPTNTPPQSIKSSPNIDEFEENRKKIPPPGVTMNNTNINTKDDNEDTATTETKPPAPKLPSNVIVKNNILYDINTNKPVNLKGENLPPKYIMRPNGKLEQI